MPVNVPTPDNNFQFNPEATAIPNATTRALLGVTTLPGTKSLGSLPMDAAGAADWQTAKDLQAGRSEEHTSELQSR